VNLVDNGNFNIAQREDYDVDPGYGQVDRWKSKATANVGGTVHMAVVRTQLSTYLKIDLANSTSPWYLEQQIEVDGQAYIFGEGKKLHITIHKGDISSGIRPFKAVCYISDGANKDYALAVTFVDTGDNLLEATVIMPALVNVVGTSGLTFGLRVETTTTPQTGSIRLVQIQVEAGDKFTGFEPIPYVTAIARCQRYYQKLDAIDIIGTARIPAIGAFNFSILGTVAFPVPMRQVPSIREIVTVVASNIASMGVNVTAAGANMYGNLSGVANQQVSSGTYAFDADY
jgi:hypothetical protein